MIAFFFGVSLCLFLFLPQTLFFRVFFAVAWACTVSSWSFSAGANLWQVL
jgi:hypothetical protein